MAKPWEKYATKTAQPSSAPSPSKPWEKYRAGVSPAMRDFTPVQEEMHPNLTTADRLAIQNFSNSPESALAYIKQEHPELEVKIKDGRPVMKTAGEKEWRVVDPDTGFFSKDFLNDAGDIAYDLGAGTLQGAATTAGAAGGLGGAMLASGGSAAVLEALRQKLGSIYGIPQEVNPEQVTAQGMAGTILPGAGSLLAKGAGAYAKKVAPALGSWASGVPARAIETYKKNLPMFQTMENTPGGLIEMLEKIRRKASRGLQNAATDVGETINAPLREIEGQIDISDLKGIAKSRVDELKAAAERLQSPEYADMAKAAEDQYNSLFMKEVKEQGKTSIEDLIDGVKPSATSRLVEGPSAIDPQDAMLLKDRLKDFAELYKQNIGKTDRFGKTTSSIDKQTANSYAKAYRAFNDKLAGLTDDKTEKAFQEYKTIKDRSREMDSMLGTNQGTFGMLANSRSSQNPVNYDILRLLKERHGVDLLGDADNLEAVKWLGSHANNSQVSSGGATSTSRSIPLAATSASVGGLLGYKAAHGPGAVVGAGTGAALGSFLGSPKMIKKYIEMGKGIEKYGTPTLPYAEAALTPATADALQEGLDENVGPWRLLFNKENKKKEE